MTSRSSELSEEFGMMYKYRKETSDLLILEAGQRIQILKDKFEMYLLSVD